MSLRGSDASRPPSRSRPNKPDAAQIQRSSTPHTPPPPRNDNDPSSQSRKRKRDSPAVSVEQLLKPFITIKPEFSLPNPAEKPFILKPLMLLSRECLSLSSLDLSNSAGEFPSGPGRFFESRIRILDLEGRLRQTPSILIARSESRDRFVYAIERYEANRYTVCKLGNWVHVAELSHLAEACYEPRCRPAAQKPEVVEAVAPIITPRLHKENKKKREAIDEIRSMVSKRPRTMSAAPPEIQTARSQPPIPSQSANQAISLISTVKSAVSVTTPSLEPLQQGSQLGPLDSTADTQASAEDILQTIRSQYFQALYHSKGLLAYFAKGPLSKARSAFQFDCDANLDLNNLIDFLKGLVVVVPQIDKKYKETVPRLIDEMKVMVESDEEEEKPRPKRTKSKKMKLGKDGLWTNEVDHVKKWWRANKPEVREDDSSINPQEVKYHISCLRTRETQLQMIILLEILALEAVRPAQDAQDNQLPGLPTGDSAMEKPVEPAAKKRNKHDYPLLVHLHADRMSIWQSTTLDEMMMIAAEAQAKSGQGPQKSDRANSDPLKDFCIDIIVPFFSGRLPDLCADLNRKLGGPIAASPPRPKKPMAPTAAKATARPGAAARRPAPVRASKSLDKVFESDQQKWKASRRPVDVLARMRSATPAAIPGLKREASESLGLDRIPQGDKSLKERSRNTLSRSVSSAGAEDLKAQKKAKMEADLKEAISALKKPNRQLAGRSFIEDVEKRTATSSSPHPRKQKKPVRNAAAAAANRVQVKATPANFRFRDAVSADNRSYGSFNPPLPRTELDIIPSSSCVISSTAPRNSFRNDLHGDLAAFHIASTPDKVMATPAAVRMRAPPFAKSPNSNTFIPPSSPIVSRRMAVPAQNHPSIPEEADIEPSSPILPRIFETPAKQRAFLPPTFTSENITSTPPAPRATRNILFGTPVKKAPTSVPAAAAPDVTAGLADGQDDTNNDQPALTLYGQMGWNDDYDNLF